MDGTHSDRPDLEYNPATSTFDLVWPSGDRASFPTREHAEDAFGSMFGAGELPQMRELPEEESQLYQDVKASGALDPHEEGEDFPLPPVHPLETQPSGDYPIRDLGEMGFRYPTDPASRAEMAEMFTYFRSSNVYGFRYVGGPEQILEVAFLPDELKIPSPGFATEGVFSVPSRVLRNVQAGHPLAEMDPESYMATKMQSAPGSVYHYFGVEPDVYWYFRAAPSKGKFVWNWLRGKGSDSRYTYRRVA
jgi:KTSC domain